MLKDEDNKARETAVAYFETMGEAAVKQADAVAEGLKSGDPRFQAAAALTLGLIKAEKHAALVAKLLKVTEQDDISLALTAAGTESRLPPVLRRPCCAAMMALGLLGEAGASFSQEIAEGLGDETMNQEVEAVQVYALGMLGAKATRYRPLIKDLLDSQVSAAVRTSVCFALGEFAKASAVCQDTKTADALGELCRDPCAAVREAAVKALAKMSEKGPEKVDEVFDLFSDKVASVQVAALETMATFGELGECFATEVFRLTASDDIDVRLTALEVLGGMGQRGAAFADEIEMLLEDDSPFVRDEALRTLAKMGVQAAEDELTMRMLQ
jgi:HEAT repeat protein